MQHGGGGGEGTLEGHVERIGAFVRSEMIALHGVPLLVVEGHAVDLDDDARLKIALVQGTVAVSTFVHSTADDDVCVLAEGFGRILGLFQEEVGCNDSAFAFLCLEGEDAELGGGGVVKIHRLLKPLGDAGKVVVLGGADVELLIADVLLLHRIDAEDDVCDGVEEVIIRPGDMPVLDGVLHQLLPGGSAVGRVRLDMVQVHGLKVADRHLHGVGQDFRDGSLGLLDDGDGGGVGLDAALVAHSHEGQEQPNEHEDEADGGEDGQPIWVMFHFRTPLNINYQRFCQNIGAGGGHLNRLVEPWFIFYYTI